MGNGGEGHYSDILAAFSEERPVYARLVEHLVPLLEQELRAAAILGEVKGRAKDPDSFATKAILKGYADPLHQIGDKAGVRLTVVHDRDVGSVERILRSKLHVIRCESKLDALAYNEFGYLGLHCDARLHDDDARALGEELVGRRVEIQVRTLAQSAWAEVSHEQLYKPPADVPDELKRQIYRLVGLVELFDAEVGRFVEAANSTAGYREGLALKPLAAELLQRFDVRRAPDRQLSLRMAAKIVPLYADVEPEELYDSRMRDWINENEAALRIQFDEARALPTNPLFLQPEAFLIFERLSNDQAQLEEAWPEDVPGAWYSEMAEAWGAGRRRL